MERLRTDLAIVGAGAAGLAAALTAQQHVKKILLLSKGELFRCGSTFANRNQRWGVTFADSDREKELLLAVINRISRGSNHPGLTAILVEESSRAFRRLRQWGARFRCGTDNVLQRVPPCFCPAPLAAVLDDLPGLAAGLGRRLDHRRVTVLENTRVRRLLVREQTITGLVAEPLASGREILLSAKAVILACGGNAARFSANLVEPGLTGDGYQLLAEAGCSLTNMGCPQWVWEEIDPAAPRFPFTAFFDNRHRFRTENGQFIELPATDSPLARARRTHVPISNLQPDRAFDELLLRPLDRQPNHVVEVVVKKSGRVVNRIRPHVQASNGGLLPGPHGETGINGLFVAGEIATGMHGGDRLGGMMISNCLVFGERAARAARDFMKG